MFAFWLGAYYGFWVGFIGATCWRHWVSLYEPKEDTAEEADAYVRSRPRWPRDGGP